MHSIFIQILSLIEFNWGNPKTRKPDSGTGIQNLEPGTRIRNPETGIHKSKSTSSQKCETYLA